MNGLISWFARNNVAANLLMVGIVAAGLLSLPRLKREIFPEIATNMVSISAVYPGAAPEEVEEAICVRVEEAVQGLEGVKEIRSTAAENMGTVQVEALDGTDVRQLLDDIKSRVDAIDTFPVDVEEPLIQEQIFRRQIINVTLSGDTDETSLRHLGERVPDDILALPGITQAELVNARPYEISIEVSEEALRRHRLSFDAVAQAVRGSSLDLPGGSIKTEGGEILLRTKGQAYRGREFEEIILISDQDGAEVLLGEVATVIDGFADTDQFSLFDGKPSVSLEVAQVGNQDALGIAKAVKAYVKDAQSAMPEGVSITVWRDYSEYLQGRQDLLIRNGRIGFALVFLVLALFFLRLRLAFWVSIGIPLSFLGAIALLPILDVSINLISLFAFIIVLGIVVDDAIVVGENVYQHMEKGKPGLQAAIEGTQEVAVPVIFAILTTVAAFFPLLNIPGNTGQIMRVIPLIVIPTLLISLFESKLILPTHLSHLPAPGTERQRGLNKLWSRLQDRVSAGLAWVIKNTYQPTLRFGLRWRYLTVAIAMFCLLFTAGLMAGGWIKFVFFPRVEADYMTATLTMPLGSPVEVTGRAVRQLENAAGELRRELQADRDSLAISHILASVGDQPTLASQRQNAGSVGSAFSGSHLGEVTVELAPSEERFRSSPELARRWRELSGSIPDAQELSFKSSLFSTGDPIYIQLSGTDTDELNTMAEKLKLGLTDYAGVFDITDSYQAGKEEIKLTLKPQAQTLGLTLSDLARQVRQGFYGEEAQRIQRGRDDVKVMVRYPEDSRRTVDGLQNMRIRTPAGVEVPFGAVAEADFGRGYASVGRTNRRRTLAVTADVDATKGNANEILSDVEANLLPALLADHLGVSYSLEGEQQQQRETQGGLRRGFLFALLAIYALMAIPFKSYLQPLIVMSVIPFGLIGAILGHVVLGMNLSILSIFGIVALTGVVVNDSIVLVDTVNRLRRSGRSVEEAVHTAGAIRFRPILLTSLTTVAGLTPMILEKSVQAQFLIPIAVSLAFGVLFATFITLLLLPAGYLILEDLKSLPRRVFRKERTGLPEGATAGGGGT